MITKVYYIFKIIFFINVDISAKDKIDDKIIIVKKKILYLLYKYYTYKLPKKQTLTPIAKPI